jgi:hypothetical protein
MPSEWAVYYLDSYRIHRFLVSPSAVPVALNQGGPSNYLTGGENPCFKLFDCWWERFDVVAYFR